MKTSILEYLEESARKYPDKTAFANDITVIVIPKCCGFCV